MRGNLFFISGMSRLIVLFLSGEFSVPLLFLFFFYLVEHILVVVIILCFVLVTKRYILLGDAFLASEELFQLEKKPKLGYRWGNQIDTFFFMGETPCKKSEFGRILRAPLVTF